MSAKDLAAYDQGLANAEQNMRDLVIAALEVNATPADAVIWLTVDLMYNTVDAAQWLASDLMQNTTARFRLTGVCALVAHRYVCDEMERRQAREQI